MSQTQGRTIRCPFDPSHVMPYDRFLSHLDKCKFPDKKSYTKCKFNPYHVIHKDIIASHEKKCEDRSKFKEESDEDDWGVEQPQQPMKLEKEEKQTVVTKASKASSSKKETKKEENLFDDSNMMAESFDDYDFKADYGRK